MKEQIAAEAAEDIGVKAHKNVPTVNAYYPDIAKTIIQAAIEKAMQAWLTSGNPHDGPKPRAAHASEPSIKDILLELAGNVLEYKAAPKWLTELAQNSIEQANRAAHASEMAWAFEMGHDEGIKKTPHEQNNSSNDRGSDNRLHSKNLLDNAQ